MARSTPCIDISDNPGGRAATAAAASATRRNARLCKLCCPTPIMYLLNINPPYASRASTLCVSAVALRKWYAVCTLSVYTFSAVTTPRVSFTLRPENSRTKRVTITTLSVAASPMIRRCVSRFSLVYVTFDILFSLLLFFLFYTVATRKFQEGRRAKGRERRGGRKRQRTVFIVCVYQALLSGIVTDCNVSTDWSGIDRFCDRLETQTTWEKCERIALCTHLVFQKNRKNSDRW